MSNKVFINTELNQTEEELISKNCDDKIIMIIYFDNPRDDIEFIIKEKKYFEASSFAIVTENNEELSSDYIKMDSKCPWALLGKHYALLELDNINDNTTSLDILLRPKKYLNEKTLKSFRMSLKEYHVANNGLNLLDEWYTLCGDATYSLSTTINIGTFARVSDGWKFYPKLQKYDDEEIFI